MIADLADLLSRRLDSRGATGVTEFVAGLMRPRLAAGLRLDPCYRKPGVRDYRRHLLYVEPAGRYSILALVWLPGQGSPIHSHTSWCVVGVLEGALEEALFRQSPAAGAGSVVEVKCSRYRPADVTYMPVGPESIHRLRNASDAPAISLHVYGKDLSRRATSINQVIAA